MVARRLEFGKTSSNRPIPISVLIQAANTFGCDIYIWMDRCRIDVKSYEEMLQVLCMRGEATTVYFDGDDEQEAAARFRQIVGGLSR